VTQSTITSPAAYAAHLRGKWDTWAPPAPPPRRHERPPSNPSTGPGACTAPSPRRSRRLPGRSSTAKASLCYPLPDYSRTLSRTVFSMAATSLAENERSPARSGCTSRSRSRHTSSTAEQSSRSSQISIMSAVASICERS